MNNSTSFVACLITVLLCASCQELVGDFRPEAQGQEGEILVVIDSTLWKGSVGDTLHATIGAPITTLPSQEPHFTLTPVHLVSQDALDWARRHRNVLFLGVVGDTISNESRLLRNLLSPAVLDSVLSGTPVAFSRTDEWRTRQQVQYLVAADTSDLIDAIVQNSDDIIYSYNLVTRTRMYRELFDIGRQGELEEQIMEGHGFAVNVQHDYFIGIDTTGFVWLRRNPGETWRSLFVYYEEQYNPADITPENLIELRDSLSYEYLRGTEDGFVTVVRTQPITVDVIDFKGRRAHEIRGLWEMVGEENGRRFQFGQGGGFLTYAFYDIPSGRLYFIDGMLFAPGFPKREFLRQLEVIAYTFRTSQEMSAGA